MSSLFRELPQTMPFSMELTGSASPEPSARLRTPLATIDCQFSHDQIVVATIAETSDLVRQISAYLQAAPRDSAAPHLFDFIRDPAQPLVFRCDAAPAAAHVVETLYRISSSSNPGQHTLSALGQ